MALKAGLVGVNPKGVDKNGMPIASGGSGVDEAQLTANGKKFFFAYDETSEKYGYKLDGAGDFIPFESAGGGPGWVKPVELTTEGISGVRCDIVEGGYFVKDGICYYDVIIKNTQNAGSYIAGFPLKKASGDLRTCARAASTVQSDVEGYTFDYTSTSNNITLNDGVMNVFTGISTTNRYGHIWGQYEIATT